MIYSGDGNTEYGIKHTTYDYKKEEKKSSEVVIWKWMNLAWSIDTICAGRRENIIQLLWYFVM